MLTRILSLTPVGLMVWAVGVVWAEPVPPTPPVPPKGEAPTVRSVTGPFTHGNLTVFLLHGSDVLPGKTILTLQDALAQKKAVVHETSQVNELAVENTAEDALVFIQSGDIVKGGKQDRAIAFDMLLPAKSGRVPIGSFCVEARRWRGRGAEATAFFGMCTDQISGKDLKAAVVGNTAEKQGEVWKKVEESQQKLSRNVGKAVNDPASPTSLQLALEDKAVQEKRGGYEKALAGCVDGKADVIGVALAVNGKVEGAEVYGSAALFRTLWPKLLKSASTDALAELDDKKKFEPATPKAVEAFLAEGAAAPAKEVPTAVAGVQVGNGRQAGQVAVNAPAQQLQIETGLQRGATTNAAPGATQPPAVQAATPVRVRIVRYDGSKVLLIESQDKESPAAAVVHRCYIAKDEPKKEEPKKP